MQIKEVRMLDITKPETTVDLRTLDRQLRVLRTATQAAIDVLDERQRQIEKEDWTEQHDDEHDDESMAAAAACYAMPRRIGQNMRIPPEAWPDSWADKWWKPKDRRRDLVRAAALLVAEIERIDRAALRGERHD